jgi:prophage regulatory protein
MQERLIKLSEVVSVTGLSRSRIYQLINEGRFPENVPLGGRAVAWVESEVQRWVSGVISRRDSSAFYN